MKVLFIGGTGVISTSCSELCIQKGIDLFLLNRGSSVRKAPAGAKIIHADIRDIQSTKNAIANYNFDVVVDWIAYNPQHVQNDYELFRDKTDQYIFISSSAVYQRPIPKLPITEATPLHNPHWAYAQSKIDSEKLLMKLFKEKNFPVTIVRPSHTYDKTRTPIRLDYTFLHRLKNGKKILIHDDGNSKWTLTHAKDFAMAFVELLGNPKTLGEAYHITSDEVLTWNQIAQILADKAGYKLNIANIPADFVINYDADWGNNLTWDKRYPGIFDNSKIRNIAPDFKAVIPFEKGAEEIVEWYNSHPEYQIVNDEFDKLVDNIIEGYEASQK